MKTIQKILSVFLILAMMTALLASCGGDDAKAIVGKWEGNGQVYEFKEDGTYVLTVLDKDTTGTYEIKDEKLILNGVSQMDYTLEGDTLTISLMGYAAMEYQRVS